MTNKKNKAARKVAPRFAAIIASASDVGYQSADGFSAGVKLASACAKSKAALDDAGKAYKAGYIVRYLEDEKAYIRRVGNMDRKARFADATAILAKATPDSTKPDRRTELEHKAVRAADVSWSGCKRRAGIAPAKAGNRKPRVPIKAKPAKPSIGVDLVKASPRLADKAVANDYFATAAVALLATCNKNAKAIAPQISSAVSDFHAALVAAGVIVKAGK